MIDVSLDFARRSRTADTASPAEVPAHRSAPSVRYQLTSDARVRTRTLKFVHAQRVELEGPELPWDARSSFITLQAEDVALRRIRWTGAVRSAAFRLVSSHSALVEDVWLHGVQVGTEARSGPPQRARGGLVPGAQGLRCTRCRLVDVHTTGHRAALIEVEGPLVAEDLWVLGTSGSLHVRGEVDLHDPVLALDKGPLFKDSPLVRIHGGLVLVPEGAQAEALLSQGAVELNGVDVLPLDPARLQTALALIDSSWEAGVAPTRAAVVEALKAP